jgi:macrolide-specific efflux system membrane fusion protein
MGIINIIKNKLFTLFTWFLAASIIKKSIVIISVIAFIFALTRVIGAKKVIPQYQTAVVEKGSLITNVTASGSISNGNNVNITTSATGTINTVYVKNGETVTAGQKIADITPDQNSQQKQAAAYANYLGAVNSLNSAKAKMNSLQSSLFKANQTFVKGAGTTNPDTSDPTYIEQRADWQQAESDYNNQQNVINQTEASLTSASLSLAQVSSTVTAPTSGTISNLNLVQGQVITPSNSTNSDSSNTSTTSYGTISIGNGAPQANVNLSEIDVTKVKIGQKVTLTLDAFPDKTFTGEITAINTAGSVSSNVTSYPATITFDTSETDIYPNMGVSAQIITSIKNDVLLVPSSSVTGTGENATVRILKNGQVQTVNVTTGNSNDTQTEITSGLSEGDTVITSIISAPITNRNGGATSSPFGGSGIGGARTFTGGAGGNRVFIQNR